MGAAVTGGIGRFAPASGPSAASRLGPVLGRVVVSLPDLVVTAVAGFSVPVMLLLLAGRFSEVPVLVTGVLGALLATWLCGLRHADVARPTSWAPFAALGVLLCWFAANVAFTAQDVYATRDPATYTITARWLMDNPTLHIATHPEVFGEPAGVLVGAGSCGGAGFCNGGAGFSPVNPTEVYSQGNHLVPALAAVAGWLFGDGGLFRANLVLGTLALLALFGLARRVVGDLPALAVMTVMAVSIPMIYASRDTYSEPLMMLFLMGALGLLHRAVSTGRMRDFGLAGLVAGCSAMVRIDSYGALLSIIVAAAAVLGLAERSRRRHAFRASSALVVGCAVPTLIGWLDLTRLSYGYYRDERHDILHEFEGGLLVLVLAAVSVTLLWRGDVRRYLAGEAVRRRLTTILSSAVVLVFLVLLSRPMWMIGHGKPNSVLAQWQAQAGVAVDGTRTYAEQTVHWLAQYFGWPTVVLAVAGYALLIRAVVRGRDYRMVGLLSMGLTMSAVYLWNPLIVPDQPWAIRRFVPVIIPIMLIAAAAGAVALARRRGRWMAAVAAVVAVVGVGYPLAVAAPVWGARAEAGQYAQVQAICKAVGERGAIVQVDPYSLAAYGQTMRSYCGVPSIGLVGATTGQLSRMNAVVNTHHRRLFVMSQDPARMPFAPGASRTPFSVVTITDWPHDIGRPPTGHSSGRTIIYLGTVGPGGTVIPVNQ